ncbi:MAG: dihydroorotase [Cyclobacteriaceae bacterium]
MYLIKGAKIVNEGRISEQDLLIKQDRIDRIDSGIRVDGNIQEINAEGMYLLPGVIDDQVHFREPGLTHKGNIYSESRAAVAGGITSYMEMPNVNPQTITQDLLDAKYQIGAKNSLANYSFYMGSTNTNLDEVLKTDPKTVCGIKIFMGSSTGDMLVDDPDTLENIFRNAPILIATHCEDEQTVRKNLAVYQELYGDDIPMKFHPVIRNEEACYLSSSKAVELAKKNDTRLHILHISTGKETGLFSNSEPLGKKKITSEACIHHLWFTDSDYEEKGTFIKWNPAVKTADDRDQIWNALLDDRIDVIATDHAPHTLEEKQNLYTKAPAGGPLVQHTLNAMLDFYHQGKISLERIVEKMCHAPAKCFDVAERGYLREGYFADLVLVNLDKPWTVTPENILAHCGWSPFEGHTFKSTVVSTFVSGHHAYNNGTLDDSTLGMRLSFDRN